MNDRMQRFRAVRNERGTTLLLVLLIISLLGLAGLLSSQTSTTETKISRNERLYKVSFYEAEGGTEAGVELLEENIDQRGFCTGLAANSICSIRGMGIDTEVSQDPSLTFFMNSALAANVKPSSSPSNRDAYIQRGSNSTTPPITNLSIGGNAGLSTGGAIQMVAGYEGKGKGAAGGGAWVTYDVRSRHQNVDNSEATINLRWRHVM
jgi:Tfp pilus assembly protein PilX